MFKPSFIKSALAIAFLCLSNLAVSTTLTIDATDRGWFRFNGMHFTNNKNTFTGLGSPGTDDFRSFFVFDLQNVSELITSAQLNLQLYGISLAGYGAIPNSYTFPFTIYDVSTPSIVLGTTFYDGYGGGLVGQAVYKDLGTGSVYSNKIVRPSDIGTIVSIDLTPAAVQDINSSLGNTFAIGISLDYPNQYLNDYGGILFSDVYIEPLTYQLVLTSIAGSVPEPESYVLLMSGLTLLGLFTYRKKLC